MPNVRPLSGRSGNQREGISAADHRAPTTRCNTLTSQDPRKEVHCEKEANEKRLVGEAEGPPVVFGQDYRSEWRSR